MNKLKTKPEQPPEPASAAAPYEPPQVYAPKLGKMTVPGIRRKALEHWRAYSQRLKLRVVKLDRELAVARAEITKMKAEGEGK